MIYEMGNFLCVLASIVIICIILLYPWGFTVLKINNFFSFWGVQWKRQRRAYGNGVMKHNGTIGMKQVFVTHGCRTHGSIILYTSLAWS